MIGEQTLDGWLPPAKPKRHQALSCPRLGPSWTERRLRVSESLCLVMINGRHPRSTWRDIEKGCARRGKAVRVNVTLPQDVLEQVDRYADAHGYTRSGFLARAARRLLGLEAA
jgi:hypothetical protein